jgi:hypothetical protein
LQSDFNEFYFFIGPTERMAVTMENPGIVFDAGANPSRGKPGQQSWLGPRGGGTLGSPLHGGQPEIHAQNI